MNIILEGIYICNRIINIIEGTYAYNNNYEFNSR